MTKKYLYIWWLCFGWTSVSLAQTVTVLDSQKKEAIEGVLLISQSPQKSTITNAKGQADISAFKDAKSIQIRSLGYKTRVLSYREFKSSGFTISLVSSNLSLNEIVVSSTRWRQTSGHVPSKIISITPKEVALQNPQTAADMLGASGKVFIQKSQQGGGSPMIRGFATNRLLYTVDGVRMNTAIFRGGNIQNIINLDPFATENTEVLFGPGSVIYGSDAIGGVMSFKTLSPRFSETNDPLFKGKAVSRYSSASDEFTGHFDVNLGWKKWSMVSSYSSWDFDHLRQGSHGPDDYIKNTYPQRQDSMDVVITQDDPLLQVPSAYSQMNMMQKLRFRPNEYWDFQYGFHYSETSPYGRYDRHNQFRNETIRYAEWNYGPQKWMMNQLNITNKASHAAYDQMSLRLAQQYFEESRITRSFNTELRTTQTENVEAYSINLDFIKSTGSKNTLFYGLEYVLNEVRSIGELEDIANKANQVGAARYPNSTWRSIAAYANTEWRPNDKVSIQAGLRYNQFILNANFINNADFYPLPFSTTEINYGALTGSVGAVYRPAESWTIKANFGTAVRSPNVDDLGKIFDSEPGAVTVPNPNLKSEYAYNFDIDISKVFEDVLKIGVSGYYTLLQHALDRRNYQLNGQDSILYNGELSQVQAMQNAAVANVYGVQVGIKVKLPAGCSLVSDLNYQIGEEQLEDGSFSPSRHAAPIFGVGRVRYSQDLLTFELNVTYQGKRTFKDLPISEQSKDEIYAKDNNGNNYSPSWYTLNAKALCRINETLSVSSGIENITDQRYRPYSSGLSGSGRNFILSLILKF